MSLGNMYLPFSLLPISYNAPKRPKLGVGGGWGGEGRMMLFKNTAIHGLYGLTWMDFPIKFVSKES